MTIRASQFESIAHVVNGLQIQTGRGAELETAPDPLHISMNGFGQLKRSFQKDPEGAVDLFGKLLTLAI